MDREDKAFFTILGVALFLLVCLPVMVIGSNVGKTQVVGYIVNVEQWSWPWPCTRVTFAIEHPTSIVDANYFYRTYYGYHEFELHQRYRVTADKGWFEWYPRIIEETVSTDGTH